MKEECPELHYKEDAIWEQEDATNTFQDREEDEENCSFSERILVEQSSAYLLQMRLENLYEKIDKTIDEILEILYLEGALNCMDLGEAHDSTPSLELRKLAVLEASRVNMQDTLDSRFDDLDDDPLCNVDETYVSLLQESRLNTKSIAIITNQGKTVGKDVFKSWSFYKIFPPNPPKYSLDKWLEMEKKRTGKQEFTSGELYRLNESWLRYEQERILNTSLCQQVIMRMKDIATSPIYEDMTKIGKREYRLKYGIHLRETDKTFLFTIPFREFDDIPNMAPRYILQYLTGIQVAFILPEHAHEKTRYFTKKGASLENFLAYAKSLEIPVSSGLLSQLQEWGRKRLLRFYRECLAGTEKSDHISGYFLVMPSFFYRSLDSHLYQRVKESHRALWRRVSELSNQFPEWMCKLGGVVIEPYEPGPIVAVPKQQEKNIFAPSKKLLESSQQITQEEFQQLYVAELRTTYRANPNEFTKYAVDYWENSLKNGHPQPQNKYEVILQDVFKKVYDSRHPQ